MAKQNLNEQLNEVIDAILARRESKARDSKKDARAKGKAGVKLAALAGIATDLRDLPSNRFKNILKADLIRRVNMASNPVAGKAETQKQEKTKAVKYIREGFRTVSPYILVGGAAKFIDFLVEAFGAEERGRVPMPNGKIMHAEVRLGDSMIEMSDGNEQYGPSPVTIHLTVPDAEAAYRRALKAGAISLYEPAMQFWGENESGVRDPFGNEWYVTPPSEEYPQPTVQPYLHLHGADKMIPFLEEAFGAKAEGVHKWPGGAIAHATVLIGDGQIEIDEAFRANRQTQCHLHLCVPDTDAVYKQALRAGATSIESPNDKPYGDRSAGVKDAWGNSWFIATHVKDVAF